jgi:putative transposase
MKEWQSQAHVKWECKYHVVIVPKYRKKAIYGKLRQQIGEMLRQLCRQKEIELLEGHARMDHVHMLLSVPPRYSIAMTVGYLKGKSAIRIHRDYGRARGSLLGRSFWSRGYCVSTVGFNEQTVREYIQEQQEREKQEEQGSLMFE